MAIRPSMTGPTPVDWSAAEKTNTGVQADNKSKTDESVKVLGDQQKGVRVPAPTNRNVSGIGGSKVSGSTRTRGGSI